MIICENIAELNKKMKNKNLFMKLLLYTMMLNVKKIVCVSMDNVVCTNNVIFNDEAFRIPNLLMLHKRCEF